MIRITEKPHGDSLSFVVETDEPLVLTVSGYRGQKGDLRLIAHARPPDLPKNVMTPVGFDNLMAALGNQQYGFIFYCKHCGTAKHYQTETVEQAREMALTFFKEVPDEARYECLSPDAFCQHHRRMQAEASTCGEPADAVSEQAT